MNEQAFINILIAEDNEVSREMMAGVLKTRGYRPITAGDGEAAIQALKDYDIDLALVDLQMAPVGGFEFVKHLVVKGSDIPVVIVTANNSSEVLVEAGNLGVIKVIQKPIEPDRLLATVDRVLRRRGINPQPLGVQKHDTQFTPEALMRRTIELAEKNMMSGKGGPFGAIVTDADGHVLGEGVNGRTSRIDPTAHAEVMAIRQAAEKIGKTSLEGCALYCSSQPTKIGQALVESVCIDKVYYGMSYDDVGQMREHVQSCVPQYEQIGKEQALEMFQKWQEKKG